MNHPQPGDEEAALIRPQAGDQAVQVREGADGFKADGPASVPAFEIPDVALDAIGLPADVMAQQVPTLAEAVEPVDAGPPTVMHDPHADPIAATVAVAPDDAAGDDRQAAAQAQPDEADTWLVQMQMRIDRLAEDVRVLNDRLDQFVNHTKV